jgi:hypothetical protein
MMFLLNLPDWENRRVVTRAVFLAIEEVVWVTH